MFCRALLPSVLAILAAGDAECDVNAEVDETAMLQSRISNHRAALLALPTALAVEKRNASISSSEDPLVPMMARATPSEDEYHLFQALKDLKKKGHMCPSSKVFPPLPNADSTFLFDCRLWRAGRDWSTKMGTEDFFSSRAKDGSDPCSHTAGSGITSCLGVIDADSFMDTGKSDPATRMQNLIGAEGTCEDLMDPSYTRFGAGYADVPGSAYRDYWTIDLGTSRSAADQSCLTYTPSPPPTPLPSETPSQTEYQFFQALRDLKKTGHVCPSNKAFPPMPNADSTFLFDCRLWRADRDWSTKMGTEDFFSRAKDGSDPCSRTASSGITSCLAVIAADMSDPTATLQTLIGSEGTCENLMDPSYTRFGAGYADVPGSTFTEYWTLGLGTSRSAADQSCLG